MVLISKIRYKLLIKEEAKVAELHSIANSTLSKEKKIKALAAEKKFLYRVSKHNVKTNYEWLKYKPSMQV